MYDCDSRQPKLAPNTVWNKTTGTVYGEKADESSDSRVVGKPYLIAIMEGLPVIRPVASSGAVEATA